MVIWKMRTTLVTVWCVVIEAWTLDAINENYEVMNSRLINIFCCNLVDKYFSGAWLSKCLEEWTQKDWETRIAKARTSSFLGPLVLLCFKHFPLCTLTNKEKNVQSLNPANWPAVWAMANTAQSLRMLPYVIFHAYVHHFHHFLHVKNP